MLVVTSFKSFLSLFFLQVMTVFRTVVVPLSLCVSDCTPVLHTYHIYLCVHYYINKYIHTHTQSHTHTCVVIRSSVKNLGQGAGIIACCASTDLGCKSQQRHERYVNIMGVVDPYRYRSGDSTRQSPYQDHALAIG